jgi:DinB superfamily
MKTASRLILLTALAFPVLVHAQDPVAAALKASLTRYSNNMPAAADLMPADKYGFKPTPEQMSFGEIIAHESESNETLCGAIAGGAQTPSEPPAGATAPKEQLVARIKHSFEYCGTVIAQLKDNTLGDSVPFFGGRNATRARAAIALAQDWADHYAQAAMYLRASGILPPSARPRPRQ